MEFTGRVYYDFASREVFRFYQIVAGAQHEGATVQLEWRGFTSSMGAPDRTALAAAELIRAEAPLRHGGFVQGMLAAVHIEGFGLDDPDLVSVAARAAGVDSAVVSAQRIATTGEALLATSIAEAESLGVVAVPTVYRHGPAVTIRTTPAVSTGSSIRRLELIDGMLEDDGMWELTKP
jgi:predicted DsbA family dithiol-disulfide isomerase